TCLELFRSVFLDPHSGLVLEYFDADWEPVDCDRQEVEPGHMTEWVYLLSEYERVTGQGSGVDLRALFDRAVTFGLDGEGQFLLDRFSLEGEPREPARRLWPQTELLKASHVLKQAGETLPPHLQPDAIYRRIFEH